MCELSWNIYQPWITFSTYMNVKPLNQSILSCQDYSIRKNEASKNHFNSHHLIYIWFLKILFSWASLCFGLTIEMSRLTPAGWGHYVVFLVTTLYSLLPKCLTPPRCLNGYQQMLRSSLLWISMPFCRGEWKYFQLLHAMETGISNLAQTPTRFEAQFHKLLGTILKQHLFVAVFFSDVCNKFTSMPFTLR